MQKFQRTTAGNIAAPGSEAGFSLLELAIVMVIIGLLVSGVLVGQDMIKAATLRSQLTQLSDYDTAVNTFNSKYGGIPGDYSQAAAIVAGVVSNSSTTTGEGNGNGLIESSGTDTDFGFAGEPAMFFSELSLEKLIPQSITTATFAVGTAITIGDTTMPPAKIGGGNRVSVGTDGSYNYYLLAKYSGSTNTGTGVPTVAKGLTVSQALQIDEKIDDGIPDTGIVISTVQTTGSPAAAGGSGATGAANTCYVAGVSGAASNYDSGNFNNVECTLAVRASF